MNDAVPGFVATALARPRGASGTPPAEQRALTIAIMAMGGEGGGVLADWLVELAEHAGWFAQTTSVPGVAQRTGATIYYVEMFPAVADAPPDVQPVLALMPVPGEVDVVVASELMEAGRAIQRGLVTSDRTTLIASTHRVYSMLEKIAMGDGRVDATRLLEAGDAAAREFLRADFARIAEQTGSVISAALFGAMAACGRLPFERAAFEDAVRRAGVGVKTSLAAFEAGFDATAAQRSGAGAASAGPMPAAAPTQPPDPTHPMGAQPPSHSSSSSGARDVAAATMPATAQVGPRLAALAERVQHEFPAPVRPTLLAGVLRLADYQDPAYAAEYLDRLAPIAALEREAGDPSARLLDETARGLALWMSYEDTVRVADLKTRRSRFARVRGEVRAGDDQLLEIREFLHPRVEEIADTLPAGLGRWLLRTGWARGLVARRTTQGRIVSTTSLSGYLMLYAVASLRRIRRRSLRHAAESARIDGWLREIARLAPRQRALACELAACQRLVKGYGDTHARGLGNFERLLQLLPRLEARPDGADQLRRLRDAALADENGVQLAQATAALG